MQRPCFLIVLLLTAFSHYSTAFSAPSGAKEFGGNHYQVEKVRDPVTWDEAQAKAEELGGHLVSIEAPSELDFVKELTESERGERIWIGAFRDSGQKWQWVNGEPVTLQVNGSFSDWRTRVMLGPKGVIWGARDTSLFEYFVVEYPKEKPTLTLPAQETPTEEDADTSEDEIELTDAFIAGNEFANEIPLVRSQTKVNGLLVLSLLSSEQAGSASPMTLSALSGDKSAAASVKFNQGVGPMMSKALHEVVKFTELRHEGWPKGKQIEISFENKYNPKDGPSAAVACALLLESAIKGHDIDPGFAVTGDLNADGSVQPVGGIDAKVRGASKRSCTHVAIPEKNTVDVYDTVLMKGYGPITEIQVFSISDFDQADALAKVEKDQIVANSIANFQKITSVYEKNPTGFARTLSHPKMILLLEEILEGTPNHLSAKILLDHAKGNAPKSLSVHGSTAFIEREAYSITDVIDNKGKVGKLSALSGNQVVEAISLLRNSKNKLDERTWKWAGQLIHFGTLLNRLQTNPPSSVNQHNKLVAEINAAGDAVRAERRNLFNSPEVMEELLQ